jgi:hypothetical protein
MNRTDKYQVVFVSPNPIFKDAPLNGTLCDSFAAATRIASSLNHETKGITGYYRAAKIIGSQL